MVAMAEVPAIDDLHEQDINQFHGFELLQQIAVRAYPSIEADRLLFVVGRLQDLRAELYPNLASSTVGSGSRLGLGVTAFPCSNSELACILRTSSPLTFASGASWFRCVQNHPCFMTGSYGICPRVPVPLFVDIAASGWVVAGLLAVGFCRPFLARSGVRLLQPIGAQSSHGGSGHSRKPTPVSPPCISLPTVCLQIKLLPHAPVIYLLSPDATPVVPHRPELLDAFPANIAPSCHSLGLEDAQGGRAVANIDGLVVEILSWLSPVDLKSCEKVSPRWEYLIKNDRLFLSLHPCRGGDWRNWPSKCIADFVDSNAREGTCRGVVQSLCKTTVDVRCAHALESYPQNYYAQRDELIYLENGIKTCTKCGDRTFQQMYITTHCHVLLDDGSHTWKKTLRENVVEQLLRARLFDVLAVDDAFIAANIQRSRFEALDHSDTLRTHLEGMEALFKIEYDGPGEPNDSEFLMVSCGHPIRLHVPNVSTGSILTESEQLVCTTR